MQPVFSQLKILTNVYTVLPRDSLTCRTPSTHQQQSQNVAHSVLPSVNTKRSQSPNCVLLKEQHRSLTSHAYIHTVQSHPAAQTHTAPHTGTAIFACLPVALVSSECWTRPWYRAPTYHASLPVHSHAALPGSCLLLAPSLPPSG